MSAFILFTESRDPELYARVPRLAEPATRRYDFEARGGIVNSRLRGRETDSQRWLQAASPVAILALSLLISFDVCG